MTHKRCSFRVDPELTDALSGCLFEYGVGGLEEGALGDSLTTYVEGAAEAERLGRVFAVFEEHARVAYPEFETFEFEVEDASEAWQETWIQALGPEKVTETFVLRPLTKAPAPREERTLWYRPTPSFGSGGHPTTRLAASALERLGSSSPGQHLFDVGTGSGVLALVALKSGFSHVTGSDIDPIAVAALRENAAHNGLEDSVTALLGSADAVERTFSLVVANIENRILRELRDELAARVSEKGTLLLAGLLDEDADFLAAHFAEKGLSEISRQHLGDWALLELKREA